MDDLDPLDTITPNFSALRPGPGAELPGRTLNFDFSLKIRMGHSGPPGGRKTP